jgi:CRP-like cAMP-binding protein
VFYFDEQNREGTLVFTYAPSFGGVLDAMMTEQPSKYYYETLTPSQFLRASFTDIQKLSKEIPAVESLLRKGMAQCIGKVGRSAMLFFRRTVQETVATKPAYPSTCSAQILG